MRQAPSAVLTLPLARILEDRSFNLRIRYGDLDGLSVQLMTEGQREPITVRERSGEYYVVDGHRRQRALARSLQLRIQPEDGGWMVYDGGRPLRAAPSPAHPAYNPAQVRCLLARPTASPETLLAARFAWEHGLPFSALERALFLSRLLHSGGAGAEAEALARHTGFAAPEIAQARQLHPADPRVLELVAAGRLPEVLALRLLLGTPPALQMGRLKDALAAAGRDGRERLRPRDFEWNDPETADAETPDPVHARLGDLVARLGGTARVAPNPAAEERLGTLLLIHRYAVGQIGYDRLEAHLLGRR